MNAAVIVKGGIQTFPSSTGAMEWTHLSLKAIRYTEGTRRLSGKLLSVVGFLDDLSTGFDSFKDLRSVVLDHSFWNFAYDCNKSFKMPNPNNLDGIPSGSPLSRIWNPFHLGPVGWQMLLDVDTGRSHLTARFHMLTQAVRRIRNTSL